MEIEKDIESIDDLIKAIKLKLVEVRKTDPEVVEELKFLLAQLQDFIQELEINSIKLERIYEKTRNLIDMEAWFPEPK